MLAGHVKAEGLAKLAADPNVVSVKPSKIEPRAHAELKASDTGRVYVVVLLQPVGLEAPEYEKQRRLLVSEIQDKVLGKFAPGEFQVGYKREDTSNFTGRINAAGLARLEADSKVVQIGPDIRGRGAGE